jgi:hypothetical protein
MNYGAAGGQSQPRTFVHLSNKMHKFAKEPFMPMKKIFTLCFLVLLATGGGGTMLLTGDMEFPEEQNLLKCGLIPHVDIIKIGNHGEGDATSEALIAAANPTVAVISTNTEDEGLER